MPVSAAGLDSELVLSFSGGKLISARQTESIALHLAIIQQGGTARTGISGEYGEYAARAQLLHQSYLTDVTIPGA